MKRSTWRSSAPIVVTLGGLTTGIVLTSALAQPPSANPPARSRLSSQQQIARSAAGRCILITHQGCRPNTRCNPPPPRDVACPEVLTSTGQVTAQADGTCRISMPPAAATTVACPYVIPIER